MTSWKGKVLASNLCRMHVSLANFIDTIIDYPNSRVYAFDMFERLGAAGILKSDMIPKYKQHVEHLQDEEYVNQ